MKTAAPSNNVALREAIYAGDIFRLPADAASLQLVDKALSRLRDEFGIRDLRGIHTEFPFSALSARLAPLRRSLAAEEAFHDLLRTVIAARAFAAAENAFDPLRLRSVLYDGHAGPGSERAYALHRDTWYGNPQSQVNWWIPLHDVTKEETFAFYTEYFDQPVDNSSAQFDFEEMVAKTGWQGTKGGTYPHYPAAPDHIARRAGFSASAGDVILFSAAQLHGTCKASTGRTRWSLDFRTVHLGDLGEGKGAPNVDNGSRPLAVASYIQPAA